LPGQFLSLRFQLALHDAQLGENRVLFGFEPANFVVRQFTQTANRDAALQYIHRFARELAQAFAGCRSTNVPRDDRRFAPG